MTELNYLTTKNLTKARKRLKKSEEIAEKNNIGDSPKKNVNVKGSKKRKNDDTEHRQQNSGIYKEQSGV